MPDFGIFRGFNDKLFGDKLYAGQLPTQLGIIGSQEVSNFIGLLDDYPNAAAAYSLRLLRKEYTGSAIRVRRTDLEELDIGFNGLGELDTTALLAFTGTGALDNGFVKTWYDQSGNAKNATQTTALNQPQIVSAGNLMIQGSKPTVIFNGINSLLQTDSINFSTTNNITYFIALQKQSDLNLGMALELTPNADSNAGSFFLTAPRNNGVNSYGVRSRLSTSVEITVSGFTAPIYNLISCINSGSVPLLSLFINNSNVGTNTASQGGGNFQNNNVFIGSRTMNQLWFNGNIQEIIFYPSNQSSNLSQINTNINDFYSIY
jgi:hypothetical protein